MAEASGGTGAAFDASGLVVEQHDDALRAELAALDEEMSREERERQRRRTEVVQRIYDRDSQTPGTAAHAAHVAQLARAYRTELRMLASASTAVARAESHLAGARDAEREAKARCDSAELALAEVAGQEAADAVLREVCGGVDE